MNGTVNGAWVAGLIALSFPAALLLGTLLSSPGMAVVVLVAMWAGAFAALG